VNRTIDIKPATHERDGELKAQKSRFFDIIEKIVDAVVIVDTNGIVRFVNPAATALFDRKAEDLLGELFGFPIVTGEAKEVGIIRRGVEPVTGEMRVTKIEWEGEDGIDFEVLKKPIGSDDIVLVAKGVLEGATTY